MASTSAVTGYSGSPASVKVAHVAVVWAPLRFPQIAVKPHYSVLEEMTGNFLKTYSLGPLKQIMLVEETATLPSPGKICLGNVCKNDYVSNIT